MEDVTRYHVLLLEDNPQHTGAAVHLMASSPFCKQLSAATCGNVAELKAYLADPEAEPVDIFITDVSLGEGSPTGIDLVKKHFSNGRTQVIYMSGYPEFCTPVYETDHAYFLLKPFTQTQMNNALARAISNFKKPAPVKKESIILRCNSSYVRIPIDEITYVESAQRKIVVHTTNGDATSYVSLHEVLEKLPSHFTQCHKSFVINMDHIRELGKSEVSLDDGSIIPVGQRRKAALTEALKEYALSS